MLEKNDLLAIREIVKEEVEAGSERVKEELRGEFREGFESVKEELRGEFHAGLTGIRTEFSQVLRESENMILEHIDLVQSRLEERIDRVENSVNELKRYYNVKKVDTDTTAIILRHVNELDIRVQRLEKCTVC